ncbi:MAG: hypothetical protein BHV88_12105 [Clostridiales bacterium 41_12_two_minus]|nr:MAG: hypothetical protein BHV88_12105 [Clostridiales bacterium 41_12_two_minus]
MCGSFLLKICMKKGRPPKKMKRPRQSAARQNAGPLALFGFVVNVTASFFRQFSRHISTWEKELNRRRQTLKHLFPTVQTDMAAQLETEREALVNVRKE